MGPILHIGLTATLVSGVRLMGYNVNAETAVAVFIGGVFLDGDKTLEIISNQVRAKKHIIPDITARCRILHSIFAFPFGFILSLAVSSWLPFVAVLVHMALDSFIPGFEENGKHYPSHPPLKWMMAPFFKKWWYRVVIIGWPVTYQAKMNWVYNKLGPAVGLFLIILSFWFWYYVIIH